MTFASVASGKISGLSVTALSSMSITRQACASASRTAPCTCGMQRRQYASCGWCFLPPLNGRKRAIERFACRDAATAARSPSRCRSAASDPRDRSTIRQARCGSAARGDTECRAASTRRAARADSRAVCDLSRMWPQRVDFLAERAAAAGERVERHRRGEVGGFEQRFRGDRARARRMASICVVPLLSASPSLNDSRSGASPARCSASRARHALAAIERFAAAEQHDREVRQRRKIAARADRTLFRE